MTETQKFVQTIQSWLFEAADVIRMNLESELTVQQKNCLHRFSDKYG